MLLEFTVKNYKSFLEKTTFSMRKAPKQSGLDYSLLKQTVKGKPVVGLCSSVIYGANAAGKTNIIGAMDALRSIVLRGNIKNSEEKSPQNIASSLLELIPNNKLKEPVPVEFAIEFFEKGMLVKYCISLDLGLFIDEEYKRKIINEELSVNNELVYHRREKLDTINLKPIIKYYPELIEQNVGNLVEIAQNSLNNEELFLTNGFKLIFSQSFVKVLTDWFLHKFTVICHADALQLIHRVPFAQKNTSYREKTTDKAVRLFGLNANDIRYVASDEEPDGKWYSIFKDDSNKQVRMIAEVFESYGTIRFINMFPLVLRAIRTGGTLVVDEFDASLHPMALMSIINVFHNDDINVKNAQLIFNTHNPIFLNSNLFRRDEIKFVERDDDNHCSILYALSDFGTTAKEGARKHEDYMKNYFVSKYGAIKDIDFAPIFIEALATENKG